MYENYLRLGLNRCNNTNFRIRGTAETLQYAYPVDQIQVCRVECPDAARNCGTVTIMRISFGQSFW